MPIPLPRPLLAAALLAACATPEPPARPAAPPAEPLRPVVVRDTTLAATVDVPALATPWRQATLGTKLMGTVTAVAVQVGDRVAAGAVLATIDARDLEAKAAQAAAAHAAATASRDEARLAATRLRALVAEQAAPLAQLDAAEAALVRAERAVDAARGVATELAATRTYGTVRAPFDAIVVARHVDPGAFAAPGAPLLTLVDDAALRLVAQLPPALAATLRRGARIEAAIEGRPVVATLDGIAPAPGGGTFTVTARVANADRTLPAGGSARLHLPQGTVTGVVVAASALVRDGDLAGVRVPAPGGSERRWLRLGRTTGTHVEVLGGLRAGDTILVHAADAARE